METLSHTPVSQPRLQPWQTLLSLEQSPEMWPWLTTGFELLLQLFGFLKCFHCSFITVYKSATMNQIGGFPLVESQDAHFLLSLSCDPNVVHQIKSTSHLSIVSGT